MKVISISEKKNYRKINFADGTNLIHLVIPGKIVNGNTSKVFEHRNGYKFFKFQAETKLPSGKKQIGDCILLKEFYENPIINNCFEIGNEINVAIIVGGEYEGEAYIELEKNKFSLSHYYPYNEIRYTNSKEQERLITHNRRVELDVEDEVLIHGLSNGKIKRENLTFQSIFKLICLLVFVMIALFILFSGIANTFEKFPLWAASFIFLMAIIGGIIFFNNISNDLK